MDPHSTKRARIMPPDRNPPPPKTTSQKHMHPQQSEFSSAPFPPTLTTSTLGLNTASNRPFTHLAPNSTATSIDRHATHPARRSSYSNRHSKDTLFHKDAQNRHLPKQQQTQLEQQQKFQQQLQLQQAHQEFHRQRELYQMQQRQQPLQQQQQQQQQQTSSQNPSSSTNSQHHHHHHHHHFYHVHPGTTPPHEAYLRRLEPQPQHSSQQRMASTMASMARSRGLGLTASGISDPSLMVSSASNQSSMTVREDQSSSTELHASSSPSSSSSSSSSRQLHHHHHHHHHSLHQSSPLRPSQFSEWTTVKEKERARLLSNMARVRDSRPAMPTADDAKENLKRLSQRIHQRRTRARETILYDLHQGVKTVEAQVHKQVEMVMSKLKDAPGSKYAFALTHTFLTQIPQALSNTILPSAISAVADTVAGRTTNSLTTLRGAAGEDEFDEEEDEEDEDELEEADEIEGLGYQQQLLLSRLRHDQRLSHQLSSEFDSIALASSSRNSSVSGPSYTPSAPVTTPVSSQIESAVAGTGSVSISSTGASEFLAASTHHNYSSAASQVLNAALPSFIPSMVAPIVCVFSYPTPPASKPSSPNPLTQTSSPEPSSSSSGTNSDSGMDQTTSLESFESDPRHRAWTTAEQEGLYLAATRFKLRGQWAKIRECMNLHRTEQEIEEEYQRLYGEHDDGSDNDGDDENDYHDEHSGKVLHDDGDADDEAEAAVFMKFGGGGGQDRPSSRSATQPYVPVRPTTTRGLMDIQSLINIEPVPSPVPVPVRDHPTGVNHTKNRPQHPDSRTISQALNEKPMRVLKKEFMIDKRFALEDIPMHL